MPEQRKAKAAHRSAPSREGVRLQKILSERGVASRRAAEELIKQGRVTVDGRVARIGEKVKGPEQITVDGERVFTDVTKRYIALNKPEGIITTSKDPSGRRTVLDLLGIDERVFPVGRLDIATEGLILLTNDGELAHRLMHPSFEVPKVYIAEVEGRFERETATTMTTTGVHIGEGRPARVEKVKVLAVKRTRPQLSVLEITIHEGRKHVVRRMLELSGHRVVRLVRTEVGPIKLGKLARGTYRNLSAGEISSLYRLVGL